MTDRAPFLHEEFHCRVGDTHAKRCIELTLKQVIDLLFWSYSLTKIFFFETRSRTACHFIKKGKRYSPRGLKAPKENNTTHTCKSKIGTQPRPLGASPQDKILEGQPSSQTPQMPFNGHGLNHTLCIRSNSLNNTGIPYASPAPRRLAPPRN